MNFYKIENNALQIGAGEILPDGFIEYKVGEETEELKTYLAEQKAIQEEAIVKNEIKIKLSSLVVTTTNNNTLDATLEARQNMADAILASTTLERTTTVWRMADNSEVEITLDELKEAHALAIQEYARIKGIGA